MAEAKAAGPAEFAARMMHMLNEAALALMVSVAIWSAYKGSPARI